MSEDASRFRLLAVAVHRYSRDPDTREISAQHILAAAINLLAAEIGAPATALSAAEVLCGLAERDRRAAMAVARLNTLAGAS